MFQHVFGDMSHRTREASVPDSMRVDENTALLLGSMPDCVAADQKASAKGW
jgi:hypothetical protein